MVEADRACEPVQHRMQGVVRAAIERRDLERPIIAALPHRLLELMLDEEKPAANRRATCTSGHMTKNRFE